MDVSLLKLLGLFCRKSSGSHRGPELHVVPAGSLPSISRPRPGGPWTRSRGSIDRSIDRTASPPTPSRSRNGTPRHVQRLRMQDRAARLGTMGQAAILPPDLGVFPFFLSFSFFRTNERTNERIISFLASTRRLATVDGLSLVARQDAFASG